MLPEHPIVISPTLAGTIGLEEAVLLQSLSELLNHRGASRPGIPDLSWIQLEDRNLVASLPFWSPADVHRVRNSLQKLGMVIVEQGSTDSNYWIAIAKNVAGDNVDYQRKSVASTELVDLNCQTNNKVAPIPCSTGSPETQHAAIAGVTYLADTPRAAMMLPPDWQPDDNCIRLCQQHAIPEDFIHSLIPEFVIYWQSRREARFSWGNLFYKHAVKEWREEQTRQGGSELFEPMSQQWWPSLEALEILESAGINRDFIEATIPEFVLYWRERGVENKTWNSKFIQHIRYQWARTSDTFGTDGSPQLIPDNWQPSKEFYEILELAEIDAEFAQAQVPEFVMYWKDRKEARASWNTVYLTWIKMVWADRLNSRLTRGDTDAQDQHTARTTEEKVRARLEQLADRSWAD